MRGREREMLAPYLGLFPAVAVSLSHDGTKFRLVGQGDGQAFLQDVLAHSFPVKLGRYIPREGWSVIRGSFNIANALSALHALVRPQHVFFKRMLETVKGKLVEIGLPVDALSRAFTGHILVAVDSTFFPLTERYGPFALPWVVAVGVKDNTLADGITTLVEKMRSPMSPIKVTPVRSGAYHGYLVGERDGSEQIAILKTKHAVLLGGSISDLDDSVKAFDSSRKLSFAEAVNDKSAPFFAAVDSSGLLKFVERGSLRLSRPERYFLRLASQTMGWKRLRDIPIRVTSSLDANGLTIKTGADWGLGNLLKTGVSVLSGVVKGGLSLFR